MEELSNRLDIAQGSINELGDRSEKITQKAVERDKVVAITKEGQRDMQCTMKRINKCLRGAPEKGNGKSG
jgi:hypothetical protein